MTHPHTLHCRSAAWSLNAALGALSVRAEEEAKQITAEMAEGANDGIRSSVFGQRGGSGGHGDPVQVAALNGFTREPRPNRYAQLDAAVGSTLVWLANQLDAPPGREPLTRLSEAIPDLLPGTAATLTRWLAENDQRVRNCIGLPPHLWALPGNPDCPACGMRALYVQTAAPNPDWTVICRTGCLCSGDGCPCLMTIKVEGVAHIWDRTTPLVAQALTSTDHEKES